MAAEAAQVKQVSRAHVEEQTAKRRLRFVIEHMIALGNRPRKEGESVTVLKVFDAAFTPYENQNPSAMTKFFFFTVLDRLIAIEDGQAFQEENVDTAIEYLGYCIEGDRPVGDGDPA